MQGGVGLCKLFLPVAETDYFWGGTRFPFLLPAPAGAVRCSCMIIRLLCVECTQRHSFMGANEIVV